MNAAARTRHDEDRLRGALEVSELALEVSTSSTLGRVGLRAWKRDYGGRAMHGLRATAGIYSGRRETG